MREFKELIECYCKNMDRQRELDESLLKQVDRTEWIELLRNRASELERILNENTVILDEIYKLINQPLAEEKAMEYYVILRDMYRDAYDEYEILIPALEKLLTYINNPNVIVAIHHQLYFETTIIRENALGTHCVDTSHIEASLAYFNLYPRLEEKDRLSFWEMCFNYFISCLDGDEPDPDLSCKRFRYVMDLWERPEVQQIDGANDKFVELIDNIKIEWLGIQEYIHLANEDTIDYFCDKAFYYFERDCKSLATPSEYNNEIYASYLIACVLRGQRTYDEIVKEYFEYYENGCKKLSSEVNFELEEFYFVTNTPVTLELWCRNVTDLELKSKIIDALKRNTKKTWYNQNIIGMDPIINLMLRKWCFTMTKYMKSASEKIDWIIELVVRRQLTTYLHSAMVRNISEAIGREVMRQMPEYYDSLPDDARNNVMEYITTGSLLHDIGKTRITQVITLQGRKLSDDEFDAIRNHPFYGYDVLKDDSELKGYADIAIGHHKFFDGTGGYPYDFDVLASPYKAIIDIIAISDCLDAATDSFGRNYKKAKTFDEVMEEFREGKGCRYSATIVDIIDQSPRLKNELRYIVGEGRMDTMYKAYLQNAL